MNKVDARYISFNSPEDVIKEQERLMSLPIEEMILEIKRLCLDSYDWECFIDEFTYGHEGYGKKANVIISTDEYLEQEYNAREYAKQLPIHKNSQIRSNWAKINSMLHMRETFSKCARILLQVEDMEDIEQLAIKYNEFMGRYINSYNDDRSQQEELVKGFSIDEVFIELRGVVNNIKRFYGTEDGKTFPEEQVMTLLEKYKPELVAILTGAKTVEEKYTDEYEEMDEEIYDLLSFDEIKVPVLRSEFFRKIDIVRDHEKEMPKSRVTHEESQSAKASESTVETQDTEKSIKAQKLAEFMQTQGLTQSDILELLTTFGRDGMRSEAEQQVVNIAESERSGKTNKNEGVNR